jgi:hypothetical protein
MKFNIHTLTHSTVFQPAQSFGYYSNVNTLFIKFVIDQGISATVPIDEATTAIKRKHWI